MSFNTPLEMRSASVSVGSAPKKEVVFQYSIGDASICTEPTGQTIRFVFQYSIGDAYTTSPRQVVG